MAQTTPRPTLVSIGLRLIYGACLLVVGGVLAVGGARLLSLGGSAYYLPAGLAAALTGLAVMLGRWRLGGLIYLALMAATTVWGLAEVGLDGWALAPRVISPAVLGLPFLIAGLLKGRRAERLVSLAVAAGAVVLVIAVAQGARFQPAPSVSSPAGPAVAGAGEDWPVFGGAPGGERYSRLAQLTPANVGKLKIAWSRSVGPVPLAPVMQNQATPLKVGDNLYTCTPWNNVLSLDPETGKTRWRFDPKVDPTGVYQAKCRGVVYYEIPGAVGPCAHRIYTGTPDGRLIALDAATGLKCPGFGTAGEADLLKGLKQRSKGYYITTSAPTMVRGKLVIGGTVADGQHVSEPSGVVRAYDAVTGKLAWAWDIGRPGHHEEAAPGEYYTSGTPNAWAPMSADEALGLVYVPTGAATPDYWGGHRSAETNHFGNAVVAIDAETGEPRWSFQTTHYDVWDYDVGSQPVLFDLRTAAGVIPALVQPTKRGQLFVLNRVTGAPIYPIVEKPAPQAGAVERLSPTQPWSVALPDVSGPRLTERSMWGVSALDQLWCRIKFREARYEGSMTPPGLTYSIADPGYVGGADWGSISIDPVRQLAVMPSNRVVNYIRLLPRANPIAEGLRASPTAVQGGLVAQEGSPYAADIRPFFSPLNIPCQAPPFGMINAIDLRTGKMVWSRPLGSARDLGPKGVASRLPLTIGTSTTGGALATASGVTFVAASADHAIRAFDSQTGRLLFTADLPGTGASTPMTYRSRSGRQFLVVTSENAHKPGSYDGALTAFVLPDK